MVSRVGQQNHNPSQSNTIEFIPLADCAVQSVFILTMKAVWFLLLLGVVTNVILCNRLVVSNDEYPC